MIERRPAGRRIPLIAGNWKMYNTSAEGVAFIADLARQVEGLDDRQIVVAPPFTGLAEAVRAATPTSI
jgi:triosephosphate isomerase